MLSQFCSTVCGTWLAKGYTHRWRTCVPQHQSFQAHLIGENRTRSLESGRKPGFHYISSNLPHDSKNHNPCISKTKCLATFNRGRRSKRPNTRNTISILRLITWIILVLDQSQRAYFWCTNFRIHSSSKLSPIAARLKLKNKQTKKYRRLTLATLIRQAVGTLLHKFHTQCQCGWITFKARAAGMKMDLQPVSGGDGHSPRSYSILYQSN